MKSLVLCYKIVTAPTFHVGSSDNRHRKLFHLQRVNYNYHDKLS